MRTATAKTGARYVTNTVSMAARQDGYRAAAAVAFRLAVTETRKLPRLARLAVSPPDSAAEHPTGYSEAILQALNELPVDVTSYRMDPERFHAHLRSVDYPEAYAAGPLDEGGNRENKLLEYFVSLEILDIQAGDVVIDVASERSIFGEVVREACGATMFRQDLIFPPGMHGDRIGGSAASMPVPDQFADKLVLHNSFEHFEGTADSDFVTEAWRVLKPGGVVFIVPLFVSDSYSIVSDPLTDRRGVVWDPGAHVVELSGWHNRFGRFYDASALEARVLAPARALGYELEILHFANVKDVHPRASMYFALIMRKPRDLAVPAA
jgi:SAM-dependent methyltransferase